MIRNVLIHNMLQDGVNFAPARWTRRDGRATWLGNQTALPGLLPGPGYGRAGPGAGSRLRVGLRTSATDCAAGAAARAGLEEFGGEVGEFGAFAHA